jgi:hypothetical protein
MARRWLDDGLMMARQWLDDGLTSYCQAWQLDGSMAGQWLNSLMAHRRLHGSTAGQRNGLTGYHQA